MKEKIYYLAAIETIVNKNYSTDLGDYRLEYFLDLGIHVPHFKEDNISSALVLGVKLRNLKTKKVEWVDLYYKILEKGQLNKEISNTMFTNVLKGSIIEQLNFILREETFILKKPYVSSSAFLKMEEFFIDIPKETYYIDNFGSLLNSNGILTSVKLGGKIPKEVKDKITLQLKRINGDIREKSKIKMLIKDF